jgi:glutaredoxin
MTMTTPLLRVYGTNWCRLTFAVREYLMQSQVEYDYFDIDHDREAEELVRRMNHGERRHPMVIVNDHAVTNPTRAELRTMLAWHCVDPSPDPGGITQRTVDLGE